MSKDLEQVSRGRAVDGYRRVWCPSNKWEHRFVILGTLVVFVTLCLNAMVLMSERAVVSQMLLAFAAAFGLGVGATTLIRDWRAPIKPSVIVSQSLIFQTERSGLLRVAPLRDLVLPQPRGTSERPLRKVDVEDVDGNIVMTLRPHWRGQIRQIREAIGGASRSRDHVAEVPDWFAGLRSAPDAGGSASSSPVRLSLTAGLALAVTTVVAGMGLSLASFAREEARRFAAAQGPGASDVGCSQYLRFASESPNLLGVGHAIVGLSARVASVRRTLDEILFKETLQKDTLEAYRNYVANVERSEKRPWMAGQAEQLRPDGASFEKARAAIERIYAAWSKSYSSTAQENGGHAELIRGMKATLAWAGAQGGAETPPLLVRFRDSAPGSSDASGLEALLRRALDAGVGLAWNDSDHQPFLIASKLDRAWEGRACPELKVTEDSVSISVPGDEGASRQEFVASVPELPEDASNAIYEVVWLFGLPAKKQEPEAAQPGRECPPPMTRAHDSGLCVKCDEGCYYSGNGWCTCHR